MKNRIVVTSNIVQALALFKCLRERGANIEGMGLIYGLTGEGKSTAVTYICNREDAIFLRARATWTPRSMLENIVRELGLSPTYALDPMLQMATNRLRHTQSPLFIDEADYLINSSTKPNLIDVLRDLYDETKVPVVLIGSEELSRRLESNKRFDKHARRITEKLRFTGITLEDATKVVEQLSDVSVENGMIKKIHVASQGNMGALVDGIHRIEQFALANSLTSVGEEAWGSRQLPRPQKHGYFVHEALT